MVLVREPGLSSKFSDNWSGPYEVTKKVSLATWELATPTTVRKTRTLHTNMLKPWHTSDARVSRVLAVTEEDDHRPLPPLTCPPRSCQISILGSCKNCMGVQLTFLGIP